MNSIFNNSKLNNKQIELLQTLAERDGLTTEALKLIIQSKNAEEDFLDSLIQASTFLITLQTTIPCPSRTKRSSDDAKFKVKNALRHYLNSLNAKFVAENDFKNACNVGPMFVPVIEYKKKFDCSTVHGHALYATSPSCRMGRTPEKRHIHKSWLKTYFGANDVDIRPTFSNGDGSGLSPYMIKELYIGNYDRIEWDCAQIPVSLR